jgi:hypothetical protein
MTAPFRYIKQIKGPLLVVTWGTARDTRRRLVQEIGISACE